jgi:hypothetical protein
MKRWRVAVVLGVAGAGLVLPATAFANQFAVVSSAGALARGNGATAATLLSTGTYQVTFTKDLSHCGFAVTPGDPGAGAVSGPITATVALRGGNNDALFIQTWDQTSGSLSSQPFHVTTYCGKKTNFAVVDSAGTKARGRHVVSTTHLGAGNYEVVFDHKVSGCAFVATIGTIGAGSVVNPGLITVAGRAGNPAGVFVRVVDRLGNSLDSSFHLAVTCGSAKDYAVVEGTGVLARGHHVTSVAKLSSTPNAGTYQVIFDRTVSGCAYNISIGPTTNGGSIGPPPVASTTATRAGNANGVFIFIHQANGATIDEPFHLTVYC